MDNLGNIFASVDVVMVVRGDLGASIKCQQQSETVRICLYYGKTSLVSTHFLADSPSHAHHLHVDDGFAEHSLHLKWPNVLTHGLDVFV